MSYLLFSMTSETSIPLDKDTRDRLRTYGQKGETYVVILNRLMDDKNKRSDGYYKIPLDMDGKEFSEIEVLIENGIPKRAIVNMASIKTKESEK